MARQTDSQGLEALKELEGVERRQGGARVAQTDRPAARHVRGIREVDRVTHAVKRRLGLDHDGEALGVIGPRERAPVDDHAAERRAVAADELRQRVDYDVGPVAERLEQKRGGHGVVRDDRNAARMGHLGHGGEIDDVAGGVANRLAEHGFRPLVDPIGDRLRPVVGREAGLDPEPGKNMGEVCVGGSVEGRYRDEVVAGAQEVEQRHADRGRSRADRHRPDATFQRTDALLEHVDGRVVDAVVMEARGLQVHDRPGVICVDELMRDRLVDRNRDGVSRVWGVAAMNGERFVAHRWIRRRNGAAHAAARRSTASRARSAAAVRANCSQFAYSVAEIGAQVFSTVAATSSNGKVGHS